MYLQDKPPPSPFPPAFGKSPVKLGGVFIPQLSPVTTVDGTNTSNTQSRFVIPQLTPRSGAPSSDSRFVLPKLTAATPQNEPANSLRRFIIPKLNSAKTTISAPPEENIVIDLTCALKSTALENISCKITPKVNFIGPTVFTSQSGPSQPSHQIKSSVLREKYSSPFGRVLCRQIDHQRRSRVRSIPCHPLPLPTSSRITPFDFTSMSPDDKIMMYLRRK